MCPQAPTQRPVIRAPGASQPGRSACNGLRTRLTPLLALLLGAVWGSTVSAEDVVSTDSPAIHVLLGGQNNIGGGTMALKQHTSAWEGIYERPDLVGTFGLQLRYLNEGYLGPTNVPWALKLNQALHYRDSYGAQLNYWSPFLGRCRAGSALGPEIYFDTFASTYRSQYEDRHGIGMHLSVAGQCRISARWSAEVIASRSLDIASFDSSSVVLGFSYAARWGASSSQSVRPGGGGYVEFTGGRSEIDSFHMMGERGSILWATYGQALHNPLALELSLVNEGVSGVLQRRGAVAQLVAHQDLFSNHIQLFAGVGPELTRYNDEVARSLNTQVNLLLSYGIKVPIGQRASLVARLARLQSQSAKNDADLLTAGFAIKL